VIGGFLAGGALGNLLDAAASVTWSISSTPHRAASLAGL